MISSQIRFFVINWYPVYCISDEVIDKVWTTKHFYPPNPQKCHPSFQSSIYPSSHPSSCQSITAYIHIYGIYTLEYLVDHVFGAVGGNPFSLTYI